MKRPSRVEVSFGAMTRNIAALAELCAPAVVCAVVKANAYGHGAVEASRAAIEGGASVLAVALVEEAEELREAGIATRIIVLSEPDPRAWPTVATLGVEPFVYTASGIEAAAAAARDAGTTIGLHLKVDTGMRRVGCEPSDAVSLAELIRDTEGVSFVGLATHLATADEPNSALCDLQLARFREVDAALRAAGFDGYLRHVANSAAALTRPDARFEMVRCGIAIYGIEPSTDQTYPIELAPVARVVSAVSFAKRVPAGEVVSYGARYRTARPTTIATVPIGYADGIPRGLSGAGAEALIGGRRYPIVGTVTMDQLMVDVGDDEVVRGDEVVLLGADGDERIGANDIAELCGTIGYEIVTRLSARLPRVPVA